MKLLNKKGMTLFELLAVIVILGIVAAIAFPTVNNLINNSKKDAVASNANNFIAAAITDAKSEFTATGTYGNYGYEIGSATTPIPVTTPVTPVVDLTNDFTDEIDQAQVVIELDVNGDVIRVALIEFVQGTYSATYTGTDFTNPVTRGDVS